MKEEIAIGQRYSDKLIIAVLKDYVKGMTLAQISSKYEVNVTTIDSWAKKAKVYSPRRFKHDWENIADSL